MEFFLIASTHFIALLSPGPDFFLIVQTALRFPLRYAFVLSTGIAIANGVYISIALTCFELVSSVSGFSNTLKYLGAVYLIYLGIMLLKTSRQQPIKLNIATKTNGESIYPFFLKGFLSGILNPKNVIFYFSIFTVIVSNTTPFVTKCFYGAWMMLMVFLWDCFISILLGNQKTKDILGNSIFYVEKFSGFMLATFGIALAIG